MPTKIVAEKALTDAEGVYGVWNANPNLQVAGATLASYGADIQALKDVVAKIEETEQRHTVELTPLRNQRDDLARNVNAVSVRTRTSIKGGLGENSTEYELAGGTRASEQKKTGPRAKPKTPPAK